MIQACNFIGPNGKASDLAASLLEKYSPSLTLRIWNVIHSEKALEIHDWQNDSRWNTEDGELTLTAAVSLYNAAENSAAFSPEVEIELNSKEFSAPGIPDKKVDIELSYLESPGKIQSGARTLLIRPKNDTGLTEGEEALAYVNGFPMVLKYNGHKTSDEFPNYLGALGVSGLSELKDKSEDKKWADTGVKKHLFSIRPIYQVENLTEDELDIKDEKREPRMLDAEEVERSMQSMFAEIVNPDGTRTGRFFSDVQQKAGIDLILGDLYVYLRNSLANGDTLTARALISGMSETYKRVGALIKGLQGVVEGNASPNFPWRDLPKTDAEAKIKDLYQVYFAFDQLAGFAIDRLKSYGFNINADIRNNIQDYIARKTGINEDLNDIDLSIEDVEISGEEGRGLKDWADSSFELDPRDTASKRLKFFLATIKESALGTEDAPKRVNMIFNDENVIRDIASGKKVYTVRTPEQSKRINLDNSGRGSVSIDGVIYEIQPHEFLGTAEDLSEWEDVFEEEGLVPEPGSQVYSIKRFEPRQGVPKNKLSHLGFPSLAEFEGLFLDILAEVQGGEPTYENMLSALRTSRKPNLMRVADELENSDQQLKNEFTKVASKQYQEQVIMLFNFKDQRKTLEGFPVNANRANEVQTIIDEWKENQKTAALVEESAGRLRMVPSLANQYFEEIKSVTAANSKDFARELLNSLGIALSDEAFDDLSSNTERWTDKTRLNKSWMGQFEFSKEGKPLGIFSVLASALVNDETDESFSESLEDESLKNRNPLYSERTVINLLAKVEAAHSGQLHAPMHKSSEGKSIYSYGHHTYQSHTIRQLKTDEALRKSLEATPFAKDSFLLSRMTDKVKLVYLDGIKPTYKKDGGVTRSNMSPREQALATLIAFQKKGSALGDFFDLTKSDKTTTPLLSGVKKLEISSIEPDARVLDEFYKVFSAEFDRIRHWEKRKDTFPNDQYRLGGGLFYFMPQFNFEEMQKARKAGKISQKEFDSIWNEDGTVATHEDVVTRKQVVDRYSRQFITEMAQKSLGNWKKFGLISDKHTWFDKAWVKKAQKKLGIHKYKNDKGEWETAILQNNDLVPISEQSINSMLSDYAAVEYNINYFLVNTSMAQLVSGDPAIAYKGKPGKPQLQQVKDTLVEYQKRLAKDIAPGSDPAWNKNEPYTTVTIDDPMFNSHLAEEIEAYGDIDTAADAQEVTTVREHLYVMFSEGKIPSKVYYDMIRIIDSAKDGYYEFTEPFHRGIIMQAMKPVYVGRRFVDGVMLVDYVKSSAYPLLPELTRGKEIDKLRLAMERQGIARANFKSAKKLGRPSASVKLFNGDGVIDESAFKNKKWKSAQQVLKREGFRIQQEVPYDEEKEKIQVVSQMNKLITEGILTIEGFEYKGEKISGKSVRQLKEDLRKKMFELHRDAFLKSTGAVLEDGKYTFANPKKFYDKLEQEAVARNYPKSDLDAIRHRTADGSLSIPLWFNGSADRFESMMMSLIKKIVVNKTAGKSFIQASSLGYRSIETEIPQDGVTYIDGFDFSKGLKSLHKREDGSIAPAQVLVPFNFFDKSGKALNVKDFMGENGRIDSTKLPDELRHFIGARIPNQGHNSMLPIEIVGFLPKNLGDLMIVPSEITKQMGSDFDVDKLYVYKKNYEFVDGTLSVYENAEAEEDKALQNDYFDVHWSILTHPQLFEKILKPLDKPDLKDEKANAEKRARGAKDNYFQVDKQLEDFMSQKDAKVLVGMTSLSSTFNSVIQDKDLKLMKLEMDDLLGRVVAKPEYITVLDEVTGAEIKLHKLSGNGTSLYFSEENPTEGSGGELRTKHDNLTTQQSEALDHAKNRTIDFLNLGRYTYPASAAMSMLEDENGKALNLKYNSRLLQQPIIVEFAEMMSSGNDTLSQEFQADLKNAVLAQLKSKYGKHLSESEITDIYKKPTLFNPQKLEEMLNSRNNRDKEYYVNQLSALALFEKFDAVGARLSEIQAALNQSTNGAGANLLASLDKQRRLDELSDQVLVYGVDSLVAGTELGDAYEKTTVLANTLYTQILPYDKMEGVFELIKTSAMREKLPLDMQREIAWNLRSYMYSTPSTGFAEDATRKRVELLYDTKAGKSLAKRVAAAKSSWGKNNYFLLRLMTDISDSKDQPSTLYYNASRSSVYDDFENIKAWISLFEGTEEQQLLAEDLATYAFLMGGNKDARSFVQYLPIAYLTGSKIAENLRALMEREDWNAMAPMFQLQYFQHNPDRAPKLAPDLSETLEYEIYGESVADRVQEVLTLPAINVNNLDKRTQHLISSDVNNVQYPPYLSVRFGNTWLLYAQGDYDNGVQYYRIDTLGNGVISEYDASRGYNRSSILTNRALNPMPEFIRPSLVSSFEDELVAMDTEFDEEFADMDTMDKLVGIMKDQPVLQFIHQLVKSNPALDRTVRVAGNLDGNLAGKYNAKVSTTGDVVDPVIRLNMARLTTKKKLASTVTHEYAHHMTAAILHGMENLSEADAVRVYGKAAYNAYKRLKDLHVFVSDNIPGTKKNQYAVSDLHEFVAHAMSDRHFQKLINGLDYEKKSVLQSFADMVWDLIAAVAEQFGIQVRDNSALEETLKNIVVLSSSATAGNVPSANIDKGSIENFFEEDDKMGRSVVPDNISKALKELDALKVRLEGMQRLPKGKVLTDEERAEYQQRATEITRIEQEVRMLESQASTGRLLEVGKRQMGWIENTLGKKVLTDNEFLSMMLMAKTWSNIIDQMYDSINVGEVPAEAQQLRGKAAELGAKISSLFKEKVIDENGDMGIRDFNPENMAVGGFTAYTRDLGQVKSKVGQEIYKAISRAKRNTETEALRFTRNIDKYNNRIKAYAKKHNLKLQEVYDMFMVEGDKWGLVDVFSSDFYKFQKDIKTKLFSTLKAADAIPDEAARAQVVKDAWTKYNTSVKNNLVYVDTSVFFNPLTGEKLDGDNVKSHRDTLIKELGEDLADTMIERAHSAYMDYLQDKDSYQISLDAIFEAKRDNYRSELASDKKLSKEEQSRLLGVREMVLKKEMKDAMNEWEGHNSPNVFFNMLRGLYPKGVNPKFSNYRKLVTAPKKAAVDGNFYDDKYHRIMENDELREIYLFLRNSLDEFKQYLPAKVADELGDNFLPVMKGGSSSLTLGNAAGLAKRTVLDALTAEEEYINYVNGDKKSIPIRYTKGSVPVKERERNVMVLLDKFGKMAYHYKNMSEIQSYTELMQQLVMNGITQTSEGRFDKLNDSTKNLADQVKYTMDSLMYQKPKIAEAKAGNVYSLNPVQQRRAEKRVVELKDQKNQLYKDYVKGDITPEEFQQRLASIDQELSDMAPRTLLGSKIGDTAIKITELKALSYNPFSAFANLSFGIVSIFVHGNARTDFDHKAAQSAFATMLHATGRSLSFGSLDTVTAKKILALMEKLNIMGDLLDSDIAGESRLKTRKKKWRQNISPYQLLRQSDYFVKGMIAVAMAKHQQIEVDGKQVSLWDAIDEEGKIEGAPEWHSENPEEETAFQKFQDKAVAVTKIIMGNQDSASPLLLKKTVLGRMISQFRLSWMAEGFANRFQEETVNDQLGRTVKGRYITYKDLGILGSAKTLLMQAMSVFSSIDPFTLRKRDGSKLSDVDIENMRKNFAEVAFYLTVAAAVLAMKYMAEDDDEENKGKKAAMQIVINMLIRSKQDITFYASPEVFTSVTSGVIPAAKVVTDFNRAISGTYKLIAESDDPDSRYTTEDFATRWMRAFPYTTLYPKFKYMWERDLDDLTK